MKYVAVSRSTLAAWTAWGRCVKITYEIDHDLIGTNQTTRQSRQYWEIDTLTQDPNKLENNGEGRESNNVHVIQNRARIPRKWIMHTGGQLSYVRSGSIAHRVSQSTHDKPPK